MHFLDENALLIRKLFPFRRKSFDPIQRNELLSKVSFRNPVSMQELVSNNHPLRKIHLKEVPPLSPFPFKTSFLTGNVVPFRSVL